ncbi:MAG: PIG-L family deacetylase [Candidatus Tectomicrobia bacterium]|uniref:PIG-L family deacetylase n=1 Tax=Tectimicrobiota bacterium TaxID=2528274 RepID=A0A932FY07_UNCTE|nr:PIG-L family deacetylase [Candidatus Tectomicrobia bacterium]
MAAAETQREIKKVLVIMAHPDDAELGCGGTLAKWIQQEGKEVYYIVCTDGSKGTKDRQINPHALAEIREKEQEKAAQVLGVQGIIFLRHLDGELKADERLGYELTTLIRYHRPDRLVTHDPWRHYLIHPDHRAAGLATTDAVVAARDHLFLPALLAIGLEPHAPKEIYYTFPDNPDIVSDITEFMEVKLAAVAQHKSQMDPVTNWQDRVRGMGTRLAEKEPFAYAEIFKRVEL